MSTTAGLAFSSAGIVFKIGTTAISKCMSTPDFGKTPNKIDVSSFDNTTYTTTVEGLMDASELDFDFYDDTTNFNAAHALDGQTGLSYSLEFPNGMKYSWTGSHRTYHTGASVGSGVQFRISATATSEITVSGGSGGGGT